MENIVDPIDEHNDSGAILWRLHTFACAYALFKFLLHGGVNISLGAGLDVSVTYTEPLFEFNIWDVLDPFDWFEDEPPCE